MVNRRGELVGVNFVGHLAKDFTLAIPSEYVTSLSQRPAGYTLKDDFDCWWAENYEWERRLWDITRTHFRVSMPREHLHEAAKAVLPEWDPFIREVVLYHPRYPEIQEVHRLFLARLRDEYEKHLTWATNPLRPIEELTEAEFEAEIQEFRRRLDALVVPAKEPSNYIRYLRAFGELYARFYPGRPKPPLPVPKR